MASSFKNYKLIVSDVDGTLMGAERVISDTVRGSIIRWQESGRLFTIASGRQYLMFKDDIENLRIKTPVIVRGGAEIVDSLTGRVIYSQYIDEKTTKELVNHLRAHNYDVMIEKDDAFYSTYLFEPTRYLHIKRFSLSEFGNESAPKINVPLGEQSVEEFEEFADDLVNKFPQLHIVRTYNDIGKALDITSMSATKNLAVLELIKILDLDREDTVGVGDGYNDFPLLEACGLKVAMGNANDELKEIADMVVPDYKNDGVAHLIESLLKRN